MLIALGVCGGTNVYHDRPVAIVFENRVRSFAAVCDCRYMRDHIDPPNKNPIKQVLTENVLRSNGISLVIRGRLFIVSFL